MKYVIILVLAVLTIAACTSTSGSTKAKDVLHGKWSMTSFVAFMPAIPDLAQGDVVWDFNSGKKTMTVKKKDSEKHDILGPSNGEYKYSIKDETVMISGKAYFFKITDGKLRLDSNTDPKLSKDRPIMGFERLKLK